MLQIKDPYNFFLAHTQLLISRESVLHIHSFSTYYTASQRESNIKANPTIMKNTKCSIVEVNLFLIK